MEIKLSRKIGPDGYKLNESQIRECIARYTRGESIISIASQLNISQNMIIGSLKRNNIRIYPKNSRRVATFNDIDQLIKDYQHGFSISALSKRYMLHIGTIKKLLIKYNIYKIPTNQPVHMNPMNLNKAKDLAKQGVAYRIIGEQLGYSVWVINKSLFAAGIHRKKAEQSLSTYQAQIRRLSEKSYNNHKSLLNPTELIRGRTSYHLDHIYSVYDGFTNNVSVNIISHPMNLRLLNYHNNITKRTKSDHTLEELIQKINKFDNN